MGKIAIFGGTFDPIHWGHLLVAEVAASQLQLDRVIWMPDRVSPHKSRPDLAAFDRRREMVALAIARRLNFVLAPLEANAGTSFAIDTLLYLQNLYPDDRYYWIAGADAFQSLPKWYRCQEIGGLCDWLVAPRPSPPDVGREQITEARMLQNRGLSPILVKNPSNSEGGEGEKLAFDCLKGVTNADLGLPSQTQKTGFFNKSAGENAVFAQKKSVSDGSYANPMNASCFQEPEHQVATKTVCHHTAAQMASKNVQIRWEVLEMRAIGISSSSIRRCCAEGRSIGCLVPEAVSNYIAAHRLYRKT